ncbi:MULTISPECIES: GNAT family N-acetyltransferase [unclassified Bacillus (in: firmicutes)]|uniref:GNAT family N-acetyltransferase n=1 Tax=unclassified Bacillus (in: firmicutes) TaxID=185979 RepID=UPI000BF8B86A|nr:MULTISPECIES: GNAT family N-acetyltransferase [unclassified Bacillus (in: firmicutes)]PEU18115.1 GNAT family N-acetyltransferase [Bacillus sp. AFS014408]PFW62384.1 GNAT family N-acetyltransferase [Bacillus sp. AFS075034]
MSKIMLRNVIKDDLPIFFKHQQNREANYMAAFTRKDPHNWEGFTTHWNKILMDEDIIKQTIIVKNNVVGHILRFEQFGEPEVSYWIGKEYWGKGIATKALREFLKHITIRPLYARAAKDNAGSLKVLEKCGFIIIGEDSGFSNTRGEDVEEFIFTIN